MPADKQEDFVEFMAVHNADFNMLGTVTGDTIQVDDTNFGTVKALKDIYDNALGNHFKA